MSLTAPSVKTDPTNDRKFHAVLGSLPFASGCLLAAMARFSEQDPLFGSDGNGATSQQRGVADADRADKVCHGNQLPAWATRHPPPEGGFSSRSVKKPDAPAPGAGRSPLNLPMQFLTVAKTAAFFQVSEKTIRRMIARGELPIVRIGRSVRIRQEAIEKIVRRNE